MFNDLINRLRRPQLLTAGGLVLGVLGAALVLTYVRSVEGGAATSGRTVSVLVADQPVPAGTAAVAVSSMVRREQVPERYARPGALADLDVVSGQVTVESIAAGEMLSSGDFAASGGTKGHLPIPLGREAVAVAVTLDAGVARWPAAGDRVNVYATFKDADARTSKILSDIEVLATDPPSGAANAAVGRGELVYLLAVTPDEAARVVFAKELGSVWLTLVPEGQQSPPVAEVRSTHGGGR